MATSQSSISARGVKIEIVGDKPVPSLPIVQNGNGFDVLMDGKPPYHYDPEQKTLVSLDLELPDCQVGSRIEVLTPTYHLDASPSAAALSGNPGDTVTYLLQVTNTGNTVDFFGVTVQHAAWPISTPNTIGPLGTRGKTEVEVGVLIPADAAGGAFDTTSVFIVSKGDSRQRATVVLTTRAEVLNPPRYDLFLPFIVRQAG